MRRLQQGTQGRASVRLTRSARRAQEGREQRDCRLERDRERARTRRLQQGAQQRESERIRRTTRALEGTQERNTRLELDRNRNAQMRHSTVPIFGQTSILNKMHAFHTKMSQCTLHCCTTCCESVLSLAPQTLQSECSLCSRDKGNPKLYSVHNNMDPGHVPTELQGLTQIEEMRNADLCCDANDVTVSPTMDSMGTVVM